MQNSQIASIRKATLSDLPAIFDIYHHAVAHTCATFDTKPKSTQEQIQWYDKHNDRLPVIVLEKNNIILGWASLSSWSERCAYEKTAESSVYIHPEHHRQGWGEILMKDLLARARENQLHTLLARIADESAASVRLHEKLGFRYIGTLKEVGRKFDRWVDVLIYQLMVSSGTQEK